MHYNYQDWYKLRYTNDKITKFLLNLLTKFDYNKWKNYEIFITTIESQFREL